MMVVRYLSEEVLILVLMEDALREYIFDCIGQYCNVLILVLMEDALRGLKSRTIQL